MLLQMTPQVTALCKWKAKVDIPLFNSHQKLNEVGDWSWRRYECRCYACQLSCIL